MPWIGFGAQPWSTNFPIQPDSRIDREEHVRKLIERTLPGIEIVELAPVTRSFAGPPTVYRATFQNGRSYAVKTAPVSQPASLARNAVATEAAVVRGLSALGCNVPRLVAFDASLGVIITEWLDGPTLEQRLSSDGPDGLDAAAIMRACLSIEIGIDSVRKRLPDQRSESAARALLRETAPIFESVRLAAEFLRSSSEPPSGDVDEAISRLERHIVAGRWTMGTRDYNASNMILTAEGPYLIDFSAIGADWPERRLVGRMIATGAGRSDGNFVSALDETSGKLYDDMARKAWDDHAGGDLLDAHYLTAILHMIGRLLHARKAPDESESQSLIRAWPNANGRIATLRRLIPMRLFPNPAADELRALLGYNPHERK